jgi:hypothetical protein
MKALSAIVWAAWAALAPTNAAAGDDLPPDFKAWWERITAGGADGPNWDGISLKYRVEFVYLPPAKELESLRARVAGKPEHPERPKLESYERYIATGKAPATQYQIWRMGQEWRCAKSWDRPERPYWDFGWSREGAWELLPQTLIVSPPDATAHSHASKVASVASGVTHNASLFLSGGLISAGSLQIPIVVRMQSAGRWSAEGTRKDDRIEARLRAQGTWMGNGRGTVERCILETRPQGAEAWQVGTYISEGWKDHDDVGIRLASVVTLYNNDNAPEQRYVLLGVEEFTSDQFRSIVRVPELNKPDPVRGALTFRTVRDTRPDATSLWEGQGLEPTIAQVDRDSREWRWRIGGWVLAGILTVAFVLLRMARIRAQAETTRSGERRNA